MGMERGPVSLRALLGIAVLLMGLMVLLSRHGATAQRPSARAAAMAATAAVAVAVPAQPSASATRERDTLRRTRLAHDVAMVTPVLEQWSAAAMLARETPPAALQSRIATLQGIRARFGLMQLSEQCALDAQRANGAAMDAHITYFIALKNQWPTVQQRLEQAERASNAAKAAGAACRG